MYVGPHIVSENLQIGIDFSSTACYSGAGTQFNNLVRKNNSVGYLKNSAVYSNDKGGIITTNGAQSGQLYNVGDRIDILRKGSGTLTVQGASGVTVNGTPGLLLRAQWSSATLIKLATDSWVLIGDLQA